MFIDYVMFLALVLTVMSYFSATRNAYLSEYAFQFHLFNTPFFILGIVYEDMGAEDQQVSCLRVGLIFFVLSLTTYKFHQESLDKSETLRLASLSWWQKGLSYCSTLIKKDPIL